MPKAIWNGTLLAESADTVIVEGNHYFPPESIQWDFFQKSSRTTHCPWKGDASYYTLIVDGETNLNAAWYYPDPTEKAAAIKDHVAFWNGVRIEE